MLHEQTIRKINELPMEVREGVYNVDESKAPLCIIFGKEQEYHIAKTHIYLNKDFSSEMSSLEDIDKKRIAKRSGLYLNRKFIGHDHHIHIHFTKSNQGIVNGSLHRYVEAVNTRFSNHNERVYIHIPKYNKPLQDLIIREMGDVPYRLIREHKKCITTYHPRGSLNYFITVQTYEEILSYTQLSDTGEIKAR